MAGYYSRPAQLARQMRQLLFPRRCPCCRRVLGTLPLCEVCTPRLEELRRGPVMRLDVSRHYLGALDGAAAMCRNGWRSLWPMHWASRCCQRRSAASGPDAIRQDSRWTSVWQMRPVPSGRRSRSSWKGSGCCWWMTSSPPALPPQPARRHCWMRAPTASLPWQWQSPKMKWTHHRELLDDERKIQKKSKKNKKSA